MSRSASPWRLLAGIAAIAALVGMGYLLLPDWGSLRVPAMVEAAQTFTLASIEPGRYHWSLRDGGTAHGDGLIREKHLGFERTELVELTLTPDLGTGDRVDTEQVLARLRSLRTERRASELQATRQALLSRRDLLTAGGRPSELVEAGKRIAVAQAALDKERSVLVRLQALAEQGLASTEELQTQEQLVEIRRREVELAEAGEGVVRSPERDEAIAAVDAEAAAIGSELQELQELLAEGTVRSPVPGLLQVGGEGSEVQVLDTSWLYLRFPVAGEYRHGLTLGAAVRFSCPALSEQVWARVSDVAVEASLFERTQVFWVCARIDEPHERLQPGMTGTAQVTLKDGGSGALKRLRHLLLGA